MKKWLPLILLGSAQFIMVLDSTVMNVSISTVVKDLNTTVSAMQAAITFYTLTMAALMLTGGKLGDIWGRSKAFRIGSIIYGLGSLITALSPSIGVLFLGWSVIEGLGAVLVIPAIAALVADNYRGRDRVVAFSILGAIAGGAAALGPLIGGFMTTYLSWRYVFAAETVIMAIVLLFTHYIGDSSKPQKVKIDVPSVFLSAGGLGLIVLGMLQSKVWGWITPMTKPQIAGHEIAPLGISIVAYLIVLGSFLMWVFVSRQRKLIAAKKNPLADVRLLKIKQLRSGLAVLFSQYMVIASVFFVVPIFLQMVLGKDALQTGIKIVPLSVGLVVFSMYGAKLVTKYSPRKVIRLGQLSLVAGALIVMGAIDPQLKNIFFMVGMFVLGGGLGLLASQLGNVNMSAVDEKQTGEVGGLQGTFQNLGSSFGTALIGSLMIAALTSGVVTAVNASPTLPQNVKNYVTDQSTAGVQIVPVSQVQTYAIENGLSQTDADDLTSIYETAQVNALKKSMFFVSVLALGSLAFSRYIPNQKPTGKKLKPKVV